MLSPATKDIEKEPNALTTGEPAFPTIPVTEDKPQTLDALLSDAENADSIQGKQIPGASWKEGEVQAIPHK